MRLITPLTAVLFLLCLYMSAADIVCLSSEVYVKVFMKCQSWCQEQKWYIKSGNQEVKSSSLYVAFEDRTDEYCIASSTYNQYSLLLEDTAGDSWALGSYVVFSGISGNTVFKNFLSGPYRTTTYTLSLYTPIMKSSSWKMMSGSVTGAWSDSSFPDNDWASVTLGSVSTPVSGSQYFRRVFTGIATMAAYEAQFNYQYGIVAYVNGKEIFRDNMPAGTVTSTTPADGSYPTISYKGVLRPASETAATESILAVEIHFKTNTPIITVSFDAFLALYAPSVSDIPCHIVSLNTVLSGSPADVARAFDWDYNSYAIAGITGHTNVFNYAYGSSPVIPMVNGLRLYHGSDIINVASKYILEGAVKNVTGPYYSVLRKENAIYESQTHYTQYSYFNANLYKFYRFTIQESYSDIVLLNEAQPLVCNIPIPAALVYEPAVYSLFILFKNARIAPTILEFTSCTVANLPAGMSIDSITCVISGVPTVTIPQTVFTVTSITGGVTYTGTFTLTVSECQGTMLEFTRTYKYSAAYEGFIITLAGTDTSILTVAPNSGQKDNEDKTYLLCTTESRLSVNLESSQSYWYSESYLYVNVLLSETDKETLVRARFDSTLGAPVTVYFNAQYAIKPMQQWYYKMSMVPDMWYNSATDGWSQAATGTFPAPTNRIQLYKKTFTVTSLANTAGYTVSLRYKYGCVIYVNDIEVFRNGVAAGPVTTTSEVSNFYPDIKFHTVSLPSKTMMVGIVPGVAVLKQGSNNIAIALVAMSDTQTSVSFDATVNLMGQDSSPRVWDYSIDQINSYSGGNAFNEYYGDYYHGSTCGDNSLTLTFNNDRREWISSIDLMIFYSSILYSPVEFNVLGRNSGSDVWKPIKTVTGLKWSLIGQHNKIWLENNESFNQYKFSDWNTGNPSKCSWRVQRLMLYSDNLAADIPTLTYPTPSSVFKDIEMAEIYPSNTFYTDFSSNPPLPTGIVIDTQSGVISGLSIVEVASRKYQITARKATGGPVTFELEFDVKICTGGQSLMTIKIRSDNDANEGSYKLHVGPTINGEVVVSASPLPAKNSLIFVDQCLKNGIYTFEGVDSWGDGWSNPAGWSMSLDYGEMLFDMRMVPRGPKPTIVTNVFSSYLPFQVVYTTWKIFKAGSIASDWNTLAFNDASWTEGKAASIEISDLTTVYVRKSFDIPSLNDYSVLNIRVKYTGGAAVYFNGRRVARFNLEEEFTAESTGVADHDATKFSKFHIILATSGAVQGNNVIAIEIHRGLNQPSSVPFEFDATGVFGVDTCVPVLDTYSSLTGSVPTSGQYNYLMDMSPITSCTLPNIIGTNINWTVENLEGSKFNSYGMYVVNDIDNWGIILSSLSSEDDDVILDKQPKTSCVSRTLSKFDTPVGIVGFTSFKFAVTSTGSNPLALNDMVFSYCKASGSVCDSIGDYPAVSEGQISPSICDHGYKGYSFRLCTSKQLGPIINDKCVQKPPMELAYLSPKYVFVMNTKVSTDKPTYKYIIEKFKLQENVFLPNGLQLDPKSGVISGIPTSITDGITEYTIYGENKEAAASVKITIQVRNGECKAEGNFLTTSVNEVAVYECAMSGNYIGTQKRVCILGEHDGEWKKATGMCLSTVLVVVLVVIVLAIVLAAVFIIIRSSKRTKAVGGVKSKRSEKPTTKKSTTSKKKSTIKAVSV